MADKILFFDAGPIISLVMSRVAWILPELKKKFGGKFYITPAVQKELVERPLSVKRYEFEALQVMKFIREGVLEVYTNVPQKKVQELQLLANTSFSIAGKSMDIIQSGEMESVASALQLKAAVVMDERTLRLFIENSLELQGILEYRFSSKIQADKIKIKQFSASLQGIPIIRSTELVGIAYKLGLLDGFIPPGKDGKGTLLDAVLWATKYNGCAITEQEIEEVKGYLLK